MSESEKVIPNILKKCKLISSTGDTIEVFALRNEEYECFEIFKALRKRYGKRARDLPKESEKVFLPNLYNGKDIDWNLQTIPHYNLMFSGGFDSTALLLDHMKRGDKVIPFFLSFRDEEFNFVNITVEMIRSVYPNQLGHLKRVFGSIFSYGEEESEFTQQPFAAFLSAGVSRYYLEKCIATEIAYCMNDDALSYLPELKNLYNARLETTWHEYRPPLEFPLIKRSHWKNSAIVDDFMEDYDFVFPITINDDTERDGFYVYEKPIVGEVKFERKTDTWLFEFDGDVPVGKLNKSCWKHYPCYIIHIHYKEGENDKSICKAI